MDQKAHWAYNPPQGVALGSIKVQVSMSDFWVHVQDTRYVVTENALGRR